MAINATNYDGTKDYKIAEVGDVYHPNLLINGDFLSWQRGDSITQTAETAFYSADMWRANIKTGTVIEKTADGMKFSPKGSYGWLGQYAEGIYAGKTHTLVVRAKANKATHCNIQLHSLSKRIELTTEYQDFVLTGVFNANDSGYFPVAICSRLEGDEWNGDEEITIDYADLKLGDSVYEHIAEDKTIATERCQRFVYRTPGTICGYNWSDQKSIWHMCENLKNMKSDPTVVFGNLKRVNLCPTNGSSKTIDITSATASIQTGEIKLLLASEIGYTFSTINGYYADNSVLLTCEPL